MRYYYKNNFAVIIDSLLFLLSFPGFKKTCSKTLSTSDPFLSSLKVCIVIYKVKNDFNLGSDVNKNRENKKAVYSIGNKIWKYIAQTWSTIINKREGDNLN